MDINNKSGPKRRIKNNISNALERAILSIKKGDTIGVFKTGYYLKLDKNNTMLNTIGYLHLFFNINDEKVLSLSDSSEGYFVVEIEEDGLNIKFSTFDDKTSLEKFVIFSDLNSKNCFDNQTFFGENYQPEK